MNFSRAVTGKQKREAVYFYDPKWDIDLTFKEEKTRKDVIAWLLQSGIHKHNLNGVLQKKKKMWEIQLNSEESIENLVVKCERNVGDIIEVYERAKPLNTKVTFSSVPGSLPDKLITDKLSEKVGPIIRSLIETGKEDDIPTGRRFYWVKTSDIEAHPIPEKIHLAGRVMWVFYRNQPILCFKCKEKGHISTECPLNIEDATERGDKSNMIDAFEREEDVLNSTSNTAKRTRSSDGSTPVSKRTLPVLNNYGIDPHNEHEINWCRALEARIPEDATPLRSAGMTECVICTKHLTSGLTEGELIIARCTCNNETRENVFVKCSQKDCRDWFDFPKGSERTICRCGASNFICKCNILHTVSSTCMDYKCKVCDEHSDPSI